jgi:hypothetical protein
LFEVAQPFAFDIGQDLLGDGAKSRLVVLSHVSSLARLFRSQHRRFRRETIAHITTEAC